MAEQDDERDAPPGAGTSAEEMGGATGITGGGEDGSGGEGVDVSDRDADQAARPAPGTTAGGGAGGRHAGGEGGPPEPDDPPD
jgi:hypothetical protein